MRYLPVDDDQADLIELAARMGQISELVELLQVMEKQHVSIQELLEGIREKKPFEWEPRAEKIETVLHALSASAKDQGIFKRSACIFYNGEQCPNNIWTSSDEPPETLKGVLEGDVFRVDLQEHPEYCAFCSFYQNSDDPISSRFQIILQFVAKKRDECAFYDDTKCNHWKWDKPPLPIYKVIKDGGAYKPLVRDQPDYCLSCMSFKKRVEK